MSKSDENQNNTRAHKAADGENNHKNKPSFATLESTRSPFQTPLKDNDEGLRHSQWKAHFLQLCEYKLQFGDCMVPFTHAANPKLWRWVSRQRYNYHKSYQEGKQNPMTAERTR
jgi:hypothetical protein